jgi:hypothetical protein
VVQILLEHAAMRAFALLLASGCSLYFPSSDDGPTSWPPDGQVPPDALVPTDAYQPGAAIARCEDSQILVVPAPAPFAEPPGHGAGRLIGRCEGPCRSAAVVCASADCRDAAATLCQAAISVGATCPLDGTACVGSESISCPETTACSVALAGSSCACDGGTYRCHQLTAAAATQAAIVGKWRGMVTTPGFQPGSYPVTLWIYPDGTYWPDCSNAFCSAFYYGGDGPSPLRKITILSSSDTLGSWADVAIDFGQGGPPTIGTLTGLAVDATTLRFTFSPSWFSCGMPFDFNLTRT